MAHRFLAVEDNPGTVCRGRRLREISEEKKWKEEI